MHSSTSSSELPVIKHSLPWALLLALAFLVIVEVAMRTLVPSNLFPYDFLNQEYRSFIHQIKEHGAAEIAVVGSSRGREAIVLPELSRLLQESGITGTRAESYSMSAGWAAEAHSVLRNLTRTGRKPELIIYGMTPDQLCVRRRHASNTSLLWSLEDWLDHYNRFGTDRYLLPKVILNEGKRHLHILRWRDGARLLLRTTARGDTPKSSPIRGEITSWHRNFPDKVVKIRHEDNVRNRKELADFYGDGTNWVDPAQYRFLEEFAEMCQRHGIMLVFLELPLTSSMQDNFPGNVSDEMLDIVQTLADKYDATLVTQAQLGLSIDDGQFYDFEHTNLHGALKITRALTDKVVLPKLEYLSRQQASPRSSAETSQPGAATR